MKAVWLLYLDWGISKTKTQNAFCKRFNTFLFDFSFEFRKKLKVNDKLTGEITALINQGGLIPSVLLEEFILSHIQNISSDRVLLTEYPRTAEQFQGFESLLNSISSNIVSIWYVKQRDPKVFFSQHFADKRAVISAQKFGDEFPLKWQQEFLRKRLEIEDVMQITKHIHWHFIEVDYQPDVSEEDILQKINSSA
jgi:adenylate kinase family enzyme